MVAASEPPVLNRPWAASKQYCGPLAKHTHRPIPVKLGRYRRNFRGTGAGPAGELAKYTVCVAYTARFRVRFCDVFSLHGRLSYGSLIVGVDLGRAQRRLVLGLFTAAVF